MLLKEMVGTRRLELLTSTVSSKQPDTENTDLPNKTNKFE